MTPDSIRRAVVEVLGAAPVAAAAALHKPVLVACSGGPDSAALLALTAAGGLDPIAVHVDHGLREESASEADVVADIATALGARSVATAIAVEPGASLEARARTARYRALRDVAVHTGARVICVGHTRDDQAETVLLNLLRGSASTGLAGMAPVRGDVARPLLGVTRNQTLELCGRLGLTTIDDPMNHERAHRRVWLRREIIPALEAGADRELRALLARQATVLRDESDLLDQLGVELLRSAGDPPRAEILAAAPVAVARRAVRAWLDAPPPPLDDVDALLAVARGESGAANLAGGLVVRRRRGRLVRETGGSPQMTGPTKAVAFAVPGMVHARGISLETWVERAAPVAWPDGRSACVLDADKVGTRAVLRPADASERFRPLGLRGTKTVAAALAEVGVPPAARSNHPVVAGPAGEMLWLVGYRIADHARVTPATRRFLWIAAGGEPEVSPS